MQVHANISHANFDKSILLGPVLTGTAYTVIRRNVANLRSAYPFQCFGLRDGQSEGVGRTSLTISDFQWQVPEVWLLLHWE